MTDNEYIKAFEICYGESDSCNECPYYKDEKCTQLEDAYFMPEKILEIVGRKDAEIERYKGVIKLLEKDVRDAKSETMKEFAQRVEKEYQDFQANMKAHPIPFWVAFNSLALTIDGIVKEMTEEKK